MAMKLTFNNQSYKKEIRFQITLCTYIHILVFLREKLTFNFLLLLFSIFDVYGHFTQMCI